MDPYNYNMIREARTAAARKVDEDQLIEWIEDLANIAESIDEERESLCVKVTELSDEAYEYAEQIQRLEWELHEAQAGEDF